MQQGMRALSLFALLCGQQVRWSHGVLAAAAAEEVVSLDRALEIALGYRSAGNHAGAINLVRRLVYVNGCFWKQQIWTNAGCSYGALLKLRRRLLALIWLLVGSSPLICNHNTILMVLWILGALLHEQGDVNSVMYSLRALRNSNPHYNLVFYNCQCHRRRFRFTWTQLL